jgi:hypothetical protein
LKNQYYKEARRYILENTSVKALIDFKGITVFKDAAVDSIILTLLKEKVEENYYLYVSNIIDFQSSIYSEAIIKQKEILLSEDLSFNVSINDKLIQKISTDCLQVKDVINFNQGIITGGNKKYITTVPNELSKKVITGRDFNRFNINPSGNYITYDTEKLHRPRKKEIFEAKEKILIRQTSSYPICALDTEQFYTLDTVHNGLILSESYESLYLLCLLNSKLLRFLYENSINESGKVFAQVKIIYIDPLPIKNTTIQEQQKFIDKAILIAKDKKELSKIATSFYDLLLSKFSVPKPSKTLRKWYEKDFKEFSNELKKNSIKLSLGEEAEWMHYFYEQKEKAQNIISEILRTDKQIDYMVYELYGLDENEIKIVEETTA